MVPGPSTDSWQLELFIIGGNQRSALAIENLRGICNDYLPGKCQVRVFDIKEHPEMMAEKKIAVTPTLVKKFPRPERILIGDLSETRKVLEGLDLDGAVKVPAGKKTYRDGLNKQGLSFKWHHAPHRQ